MADRELTAEGDDCIIALPDGREFTMSVEEAEDIWERFPDIYQSARDRRAARRIARVNPSQHGLLPYGEVSYAKSRLPSWGVASPLGAWPAGVPLLTYMEDPHARSATGMYFNPIPRRGGAPQGKDRERVEDHWVLSFSRLPEVPLLKADWNDEAGFAHMVKTLTSTSTNALAAQLMLSITPEQREALVEYGDLEEQASRLLDIAGALPAIAATDYQPPARAGFSVSQAFLFDAGTCRYVEVPSMVVAHAESGYALRDLDKGLSHMGLIALKGFSTQGWGDTQRLAVKKGSGARVGTLSSDVWQVLSCDSFSAPVGHGTTPPVLTFQWFRKTLLKTLGVVTSTPLSWDEYERTKDSF
jgi:hypothetical protein